MKHVFIKGSRYVINCFPIDRCGGDSDRAPAHDLSTPRQNMVSVMKRHGPTRHSGMFLAGIQLNVGLDSGQKHFGMTNRFDALIAFVGTLLCGAVLRDIESRSFDRNSCAHFR
jgi:hypothetical protein